MKFRSLQLGDIAFGWGDFLANFDRPTWVGFKKITESSAKIIMINDIPRDDINFEIDPQTEVYQPIMQGRDQKLFINQVIQTTARE